MDWLNILHLIELQKSIKQPLIIFSFNTILNSKVAKTNINLCLYKNSLFILKSSNYQYPNWFFHSFDMHKSCTFKPA
jgi:hypothetical protein